MLRVLENVGCLRLEQVARLVSRPEQVLRQLQHMQRIYYAVAVVHQGFELLVNFRPADESRTLILLLDDLRQREQLHITSPHFFAVFDEKMRYFKGT